MAVVREEDMTLGGEEIFQALLPSSFQVCLQAAAAKAAKFGELLLVPAPLEPRPASLYPTLTALSMNRLSPQSVHTSHERILPENHVLRPWRGRRPGSLTACSSCPTLLPSSQVPLALEVS